MSKQCLGTTGEIEGNGAILPVSKFKLNQTNGYEPTDCIPWMTCPVKRHKMPHACNQPTDRHTGSRALVSHRKQEFPFPISLKHTPSTAPRECKGNHLAPTINMAYRYSPTTLSESDRSLRSNWSGSFWPKYYKSQNAPGTCARDLMLNINIRFGLFRCAYTTHFLCFTHSFIYYPMSV